MKMNFFSFFFLFSIFKLMSSSLFEFSLFEHCKEQKKQKIVYIDWIEYNQVMK